MRKDIRAAHVEADAALSSWVSAFHIPSSPNLRDLTSYGLERETEVLAGDLQSCVDIPTIDVLGNHDYEGGEAQAVREVIEEAGVYVLDGEAVTV